LLEALFARIDNSIESKQAFAGKMAMMCCKRCNGTNVHTHRIFSLFAQKRGHHYENGAYIFCSDLHNLVHDSTWQRLSQQIIKHLFLQCEKSAPRSVYPCWSCLTSSIQPRPTHVKQIRKDELKFRIEMVVGIACAQFGLRGEHVYVCVCTFPVCRQSTPLTK